MKKLILQPMSFKAIVGQMLTTFAFTVVIGVSAISPAIADHDRDHGRGGERHGDRDHGGWHGGNGGYGNNYGYSYGYAQPIYVPPPVYVVPPQSPGINLIVPLNLRF